MHLPEPALFLNLVMIESDDKVLVESRRKKDWPGITFPGGHVEPGESFVESAIREVKEETGLTIKHLQSVGLCQYPDKTILGAPFRRVIYFYRTSDFSGEIRSGREGEIFWMKKTEFAKLELAGALADFIKVFNDPNLSEVIYDDEDSPAEFN
ncbi:8-oxo-dGTP diphosphatase [Lapidilactobacillus gannanensis]|jgi:8-oxo-dGTP diphosphatase|uniref:8-oxo-dGTP diphosphatase n=1 Tax=Lapidilactobacillus gannanensis TaxID=2486002 RepID=A0ABW4BJ15_9LACO|nr:8-oxo-dGTP diphosphatase [Lapidilactobacillus gannanensis]MCH4056967.1 8-oxo-dGTP diphosphatase [Lactobacillaceae bacterium]